VWLRTSGVLEGLGVTTVNDNLLGYEIKAEGGSAAYIADGDNLPGEGRVGDSTSTIGTGSTRSAGDTGRILFFPNDGTHIDSGGGGLSGTFRFSILQGIGASEPLSPWTLSSPVFPLSGYETIRDGDVTAWSRNTDITPPLVSVEPKNASLLRYYSPANSPGTPVTNVTAWGAVSFGATVFDYHIRMFTDVASDDIVLPNTPYFIAIKINYCGGGQPYVINSVSVISGTCVIHGFCWEFGFPFSTTFPPFTVFSPTLPKSFLSSIWLILKWSNIGMKNAVVGMNIDGVPITFNIRIPLG